MNQLPTPFAPKRRSCSTRPSTATRSKLRFDGDAAWLSVRQRHELFPRDSLSSVGIVAAGLKPGGEWAAKIAPAQGRPRRRGAFEFPGAISVVRTGLVLFADACIRARAEVRSLQIVVWNRIYFTLSGSQIPGFLFQSDTS